MALAGDLAFFAGYTIWRLRMLMARKEGVDPPGYWRDFAANQFLPRCLRRLLMDT